MSSFVSASLGSFAAAAQDLTGIGSSITSANSAAALSTTQVAVAAQDEVSAAIAALFSGHGQAFQAAGAQAAAFHNQLVQALSNGGVMYAATEAANASPLQTFEQNGLFLGLRQDYTLYTSIVDGQDAYLVATIDNGMQTVSNEVTALTSRVSAPPLRLFFAGAEAANSADVLDNISDGGVVVANGIYDSGVAVGDYAANVVDKTLDTTVGVGEQAVDFVANLFGF